MGLAVVQEGAGLLNRLPEALQLLAILGPIDGIAGQARIIVYNRHSTAAAGVQQKPQVALGGLPDKHIVFERRAEKLEVVGGGYRAGAGGEAAPFAEILELGPSGVGLAANELQQRLVAQVGPADALPQREGMVGVYYCHQRSSDEGVAYQIFFADVFRTGITDHNVRLAGEHFFQRILIAGLQHHVGEIVLARNHRRQRCQGGIVLIVQIAHQPHGHAVAQGIDGLSCLVVFLNDHRCALEQEFSWFSKIYAPAITIQKPAVELFFQCNDVLRERRLRNVERGGGFGEVEASCKCQEFPRSVYIHTSPPKSCPRIVAL